jgi:hypothetical protein
VRADDDEDYDHADPSKGVVNNYEMFATGGHPMAGMVALTAEQALNNHLYDTAIRLSQRALQLDPEDLDIHMVYAKSLETKLHRQPAGHKDTALFMAAVREWLIIARSERGEEKGLTNSKGIGIPGMQHRYQDEDRSIPANAAIKRLVGFEPRQNETDKKFLDRVEKLVNKNVSGEVVGDKGKGKDKEPSMTTHTPPEKTAKSNDAPVRKADNGDTF